NYENAQEEEPNTLGKCFALGLLRRLSTILLLVKEKKPVADPHFNFRLPRLDELLIHGGWSISLAGLRDCLLERYLSGI
ncbi:hypothetical protein CSUI_007361, partial [Cystoisospora suis]